MRLFNIIAAVILLLALLITALSLTSINTQRRAVETQIQMIQATRAQETANANPTATAVAYETVTLTGNYLLTQTFDFQMLEPQVSTVFIIVTARAR